LASYNRVILVGNLTRDPEVKTLQSGTTVAELGLAVNDRRKDAAGQWVDEPTFVDVTLWSRQAEVAGEYLSKGAPVLIEGRLKLDRWQNQAGENRSKLRVVGDRMQLLGSRREPQGDAYSEPDPFSQPQHAPEPQREPPLRSDAETPAGNEEIPF